MSTIRTITKPLHRGQPPVEIGFYNVHVRWWLQAGCGNAPRPHPCPSVLGRATVSLIVLASRQDQHPSPNRLSLVKWTLSNQDMFSFTNTHSHICRIVLPRCHVSCAFDTLEDASLRGLRGRGNIHSTYCECPSSAQLTQKGTGLSRTSQRSWHAIFGTLSIVHALRSRVGNEQRVVSAANCKMDASPYHHRLSTGCISRCRRWSRAPLNRPRTPHPSTTGAVIIAGHQVDDPNDYRQRYTRHPVRPTCASSLNPSTKNSKTASRRSNLVAMEAPEALAVSADMAVAAG